MDAVMGVLGLDHQASPRGPVWWRKRINELGRLVN